MGKIKAIQNFSTPKNMKQQSFLGLHNYYQKFQKNYSSLAGRLAPVMTTKGQRKWGDKENETFTHIKEEFLVTIMLKHPDFSRPQKGNGSGNAIFT